MTEHCHSNLAAGLAIVTVDTPAAAAVAKSSDAFMTVKRPGGSCCSAAAVCD